MKDRFRALFFLSIAGLLSASVVLRAAHEDSTLSVQEKRTIAQLISQLGDDQYLTRRRAELQLLELGADAFDWLQAAGNHPDLEIATRARYLLHRIHIEWARQGDSDKVQAIFDRYEGLSYAERQVRIDQLAALDARQGLGALCRIARYDQAPVLARKAALAILGMPRVSGDLLAKLVDISAEELGASERKSAIWIRAHLEEKAGSDDSDKRWIGLIDAEMELLKKDSEETNFGIVYGFLKYYLKQCLQVDRKASTYAPLSRMVDLHLREGGELQTALVFAFSWGMEHRQWNAIKQLEQRFDGELRQDRLLLYLVAVAASREGEDERAEAIADRAFQLVAGDEEAGSEIADLLAELGRHDWAEREWQYKIDRLSAVESLYIRRSLATMCLHDRGEDRAAAELLAESIDAIKNDPNLKDKIKNNPGRKWLGKFEAEAEYFLACHAESQEDYEQQRAHLDTAIKGDPENPDLLIAMYRMKNVDEAYRKSTLARIRKSSKTLESKIQETPDSPHSYNHWAWLISNTEGDFQQAVDYSLRSLEVRPADPRLLGSLAVFYYQMRSSELLPDSPSYLDTLGRSYYAVGDLENAVLRQRQAVAGHPHLLVIRRQLELFERELAARNQ